VPPPRLDFAFDAPGCSGPPVPAWTRVARQPQEHTSLPLLNFVLRKAPPPIPRWSTPGAETPSDDVATIASRSVLVVSHHRNGLLRTTGPDHFADRYRTWGSLCFSSNHDPEPFGSEGWSARPVVDSPKETPDRARSHTAQIPFEGLILVGSRTASLRPLPSCRSVRPTPLAQHQRDGFARAANRDERIQRVHVARPIAPPRDFWIPVRRVSRSMIPKDHRLRDRDRRPQGLPCSHPTARLTWSMLTVSCRQPTRHPKMPVFVEAPPPRHEHPQAFDRSRRCPIVRGPRRSATAGRLQGLAPPTSP